MPKAQPMPTLNIELLETLGIPRLISVEEVRRKYKGYAVDAVGYLMAVSLPNSSLKELILAEGCFHLQYLYLSENEELKDLDIKANLPYLQIFKANRCQIQQLAFPPGCTQLQEIH
jgi:hypothetical protein